MEPSGIEPETFRFVVQHLNNGATAVPILKRKGSKFREYVWSDVLKLSQRIVTNFFR